MYLLLLLAHLPIYSPPPLAFTVLLWTNKHMQGVQLSGRLPASLGKQRDQGEVQGTKEGSSTPTKGQRKMKRRGKGLYNLGSSTSASNSPVPAWVQRLLGAHSPVMDFPFLWRQCAGGGGSPWYPLTGKKQSPPDPEQPRPGPKLSKSNQVCMHIYQSRLSLYMPLDLNPQPTPHPEYNCFDSNIRTKFTFFIVRGKDRQFIFIYRSREWWLSFKCIKLQRIFPCA